MGILKKWFGKNDDDKDNVPTFVLQMAMQPPIAVNGDMAEVLALICQGAPYLIMVEPEQGKVKTRVNGISTNAFRTALDDLAEKIPEVKGILTDVAIDINS